MWIGVLWAGLWVAMWITLVGGKFRHGLLEKSLNPLAGDDSRLYLLEPGCANSGSKGLELADYNLRDDNENKICVLEGGCIGGREGNRPKTLFLLGKAMTIAF